MERPFTLKHPEKENSLKHVNSQEELMQLEDVQLQPSNESIQFLLSYSKALSAAKTDSLGDVFTLLN
jgi:hypothetical protein